MNKVINIEKCFEKFDDTFSPKIIGELNGQYVMVVKLEGDKVPWHTHENEDEMFYVLAPNPVPGSDDSFTVDGDSNMEGTIVKLFDIAGKEVQILTQVNDSQLTVQPFEKLPGLYFLTIQKGKQSIVKKIKFE